MRELNDDHSCCTCEHSHAYGNIESRYWRCRYHEDGLSDGNYGGFHPEVRVAPDARCDQYECGWNLFHKAHGYWPDEMPPAERTDRAWDSKLRADGNYGNGGKYAA